MKKDSSVKKKDLTKFLKKYPNWKLNKPETKLTKQFEYEKHIDALVFIARITVHAEVKKYYPELIFTHQAVKVTLTNSETKNITKTELEFLTRIEQVHLTQLQKVDNQEEE